MTAKTAGQVAEEFAASREARKKEDLETINELFKAAGYLSAWETTFLSSIRATLQRGRDLSDKQRAILDKLVAKVIEQFD